MTNDDHPLVRRYRKFLEWDIVRQPRSTRLADRVLSPVLGKSFVVYARKPGTLGAGSRPGRGGGMTTVPDLPGVLSADEIVATAGHLASLQTPSGLIPWFPGGHSDPWNHVESAMALDIAGLHDEAERAYGWLAEHQRADGSWHNYYWPDGTIDEDKLDTNVCAYVATGRVAPLAAHLGAGVPGRPLADGRASARLRAASAPSRWLGVVGHGSRRHPHWDYALLTGTSSIQHALRCGAALAEVVGEPHPEWIAAADVMQRAIVNDRTRSSRRRAGRWTGTTRCSPGR